jgi:transposase-like protein
MKTSIAWSPAAGLNVLSVERGEHAWIVTVESGRPTPQSKSRHGAYWRTLRDLSAQGVPVVVNARLGRWRCRNQECDRRIFTERVPDLAAPFARQTARLAEIVRLVGHSAGGRPSERLMGRLGMPVSDTTILAGLKRHARARSETGSLASSVRVAGVDDWAWRKGHKYGTIIVDLERRAVADVLADRSAATAARWFKNHPNVAVVSRDRAGLYAEAAREGAPQARQVADRFHLMQNFRETVERQLGGYKAPIQESRISGGGNQALLALPARSDRRSDAAARTRLIRRERQAGRQQIFGEIRALFEGGSSIGEIARKLGLGRRRVERWVRRIDVPDRNATASTPSSPAYFGVLLERRWAEGKREQLIASAIHEIYLKPERPTLTFLIEQIRARCAQKNLPLPDRRTIKARVDRIDRRTVSVKRKDAKGVKATKAVPGRFAASRPLEIVQIDHTEVDVFLVDETTRKTMDKRPWLTLAIDVFTRMVVGFHLSMEKPSRVSLGLCMLNAVYDKSA